MELERLRQKLREVARKELMKGSALLVGGKRNTKRGTKRGSALLAEGKRKRGSALLVGGRKRHSKRGSAMLAGSWMDSLTKDAISLKTSLQNDWAKKPPQNPFGKTASGRKRLSKRYGSAMLAGKRLHRVSHAGEGIGALSQRRGNKRGTSALVQINQIARQLKAKNPRLEHKDAISQASHIYRNQ